jgi:hypothetical protein
LRKAVGTHLVVVFRLFIAYNVHMFQGPSNRKIFVVICKKCRLGIPIGQAEFPFHSLIVDCCLCGEKRRYLPSEVFLGKPDQVVAHQIRTAVR